VGILLDAQPVLRVRCLVEAAVRLVAASLFGVFGDEGCPSLPAGGGPSWLSVSC
jgi:hypothetical protein